MEELELYVVRNKQGQYFRNKGYGGYGSNWVNELKKARIYPKIGPARTQVSFWATNYPEYGTPDILVLKVSVIQVVQEEDRVKKAALKRKKEEISKQLYWAKREQEKAEIKVRQLSDQKEALLAKQKVEKLEEELKSLS